MSSLVGKKFIIREDMREEYQEDFSSFDALLALSEPDVIFALEDNEYGWEDSYRASGVDQLPIRGLLMKETIERYFQEVPEKLSKYLFKSFRVINRETIHGFDIGSIIKITAMTYRKVHSLKYEWVDSEGKLCSGVTSVEFLEKCCYPVEGEFSYGLPEDYIFNHSPITGEEIASHLIKYGDITAEGFAKVKPELFTKEYKVVDFHQWILEVPYGRYTDSVVALHKAESFKVYFHERHEFSGEYAYETNVSYEVDGQEFKVCVKKETLDKFCCEVTE